MDDLRLLTENVDTAIPINGGVNSVKVANTNPLEKNIIAKVGKMTGFPFTAKRSPISGIVPPGCFFWNGTPMNTEETFDIYISKFTLDGNYFTRIADLIEAGAVLHFKDFAGRSTLFNVVSFTETVDIENNPYLILSINGFAENLDYAYQVDEELLCMLEFLGNFNGAEYELERVNNIVNLKRENTVVSAVDIEEDRLISVGTITVAANNVTVPNASAKIGGQIYTKATPTVLATPYTTPTYKRIDILEINNLGEVVRKQGTETLATAIQIQPTFSVGAVLITTLYVSDSIIVTPPSTGINYELSIKDSLDVEQFKVTNFFKFKGFSFDQANKMLITDPLVGGVIFVNNTTGNDATAQPENRNKPFKTLNAAIAAFWNFPDVVYIDIIDNSTYNTNVIFNNGTTRKFDLRSNNTCTVNITTTTTYILSGQELNINLPSGTVVFNPTIAGSVGFLNGIVSLNVKNLEFGANYQPSWGNTNAVSIISENLTIRTTTGIVEGNGGTRKVNIKAGTIFFRGAGAKLTSAFMKVTLDFNLINHDNTFILNSNANTSLDVDHGSIIGVSPYVNTTNVKYMFGTNANVRYKNGAVISSNVTIDKFNTTGNLIITGIVTANNSDSLVSNVNTSGLQFNNASIITKNLIGKDTSRNNTGYVTITNSYIRLNSGGYLISYKESGGSLTYENPTLEFFGSNYVIGDVNGFELTSDETFWVSLNNPTIQMTRGTLNTNGKFNRQTVNIIESPLNQYFDTVQRQLVLVDEKEEIINKVLDSTKTYVVNGTITLLTGEYIEIPAGGLTITGYGFDTTTIIKNVASQSIFKSPVGNSGNLVTKDIKYNSGLGMVFDITDDSGVHAIELNDVNFENCSSLGKIKGYRQFTGLTVGVYGCSDGLMVSGTWNGFSISKLHVRNFGSTGTLFKKDTDTVFSNRFLIDSANISGVTGIKLLDFDSTIFTKDELLQITNSVFEVAGTISESNTAGLIPNITANNVKSRWVNSIGIRLTPMKYFDMRSPDGNAWRVEVTNAGVLTQTLI